MGRQASVPKMHQHKSGQARVRIAGKDHYLGKYGSPESLKRYQELVGKHLLNQDADATPKCRQDVITVPELLAAYWQHAKEYYPDRDGKPPTERVAMGEVIKLLRQELPPDTLCVDFGPLRLKRVRESMVERGWSRPFINKQCQRIVRIFRFGSESEMVPAESYYGLKSVPGLKRGRTQAPEPDPIKPVDLADVNAAIPFMPKRVAAMVKLQLATAMRPGEICIMRPCDIDRSGEAWTFTPSHHKTAHHGHSRTIHIGPKGQAILEPWLEAREPDGYCFNPAEAREERYAEMRANRKSKIQPSQRHGRRKKNAKRLPADHYTNGSYAYAIARACKAAGIALWAPNRLRHTAASVIRKDYGLEAAQVALGHRHAAVSEVYAERDWQLAEQVAMGIG